MICGATGRYENTSSREIVGVKRVWTELSLSMLIMPKGTIFIYGTCQSGHLRNWPALTWQVSHRSYV